jgi:hypothetical protein
LPFILFYAGIFVRPIAEKMANGFINNVLTNNVIANNLTRKSGIAVFIVFVVLSIVVVVAYTYWPAKSPSCPKTIHRNVDGTLTLDTGIQFNDMNEFEQWWHSSGSNAVCPLPLLTGAKQQDVMDNEGWPDEQTYAKTPIYKVDDYEFSRVFGYERDGRMVVPRQNFNMILNERNFDWTNKPLTSDERRDKYRGLQEGFSADGELRAVEDDARDAAQRYVPPSSKDCKDDKIEQEVKKMVDRAYSSDSSFEPVITKVGPNHWEVMELRPKRPAKVTYADPVDNRVVNTDDDAVDIRFRFREQEDIKAAIDPYYTTEGKLDWGSEKFEKKRDPFAGVVPNMDRAFGPTFDHVSWTNPTPGHAPEGV